MPTLRSLLRLLPVATLAAMLPISAGAQIVNNGDAAWAFLSGQRTAPLGGLTTTGSAWTNGFTLAWDISYDGGSQLYTYEYTATFDPSGGGGLSHFILQFSPGCTSTLACIGSATYAADGSTKNGVADVDYTIGTNNTGAGNVGMPSAMYGVKFDMGGEPYTTSPTTVTFTTTHAPVWGDFYGKGGSSNWVLNDNFGQASGDLQGYIVRPNGVEPPPVTATPEPASIALLATGLAAIGGVARRRRRATT